MAQPAGRKDGVAFWSVLLVLSTGGLFSFLSGFYPVKPLLPGYTVGPIATSAPAFTKLVFIVIDALRSDFALGPDSEMPFLASLIGSGNALPYTAISTAPTVTLPRLKAITTGSNPTFLDAILNIAEDSSSLLENVDSWVRQFAKPFEGESKKIVFVGDDTWLRLFPKNWFIWSEGVTSFFVSDTQTVDTNVTRHLPALLAETRSSNYKSSAPSSWDVLILHYLGLDHVGHLGGPSSPLMQPKQQEMDDVIERVYKSLAKKDSESGEKSLIIVVGDHGMTDMGNHGGSTEGETSAALLFISPSIQFTPVVFSQDLERRFSYYERVQQIDLVPTLSALFGLGIPVNSMSKAIPSVLEAFYRPEVVLSKLSENRDQIRAVLQAAAPDSEELRGSAVTKEEIILFLSSAQSRLLSTFGDYHINLMISGLLLLAISALALIHRSQRILRSEDRNVLVGAGLAIVMYLGSMFATSFIEEEHEFWYYLTGTFCILLAARPNIAIGDRARFAFLAVTVRLMSSWNKNGQKDIPNSSISAYLTSSPQLLAAICLSIFSIRALVGARVLIDASKTTREQQYTPKQLLQRAFAFGTLFVLSLIQILLLIVSYLQMEFPEYFETSYFYRLLRPLDLSGSVALARAGFVVAGLTILLAKGVEKSDKNLNFDPLKLSTIMMTLMSLTRASNVPLFFLIWVQYRILSPPTKVSPLTFTVLLISLQYITFFAMGGSNSLATIDLSQAYNGISSYDVRFVSILTYLSNFSGPIFWSLASPILIRSYHSSPANTTDSASPIPTFASYYTLKATFHSLSLLALALSATHFRRHLFTWTVFSPAILYRGVWSVLISLLSDVVLAKML